MKRAVIATCLMSLLTISAAVHAQYTYVTNFDNTITITGYNCSSNTVLIPDTITTLPVTSIGGGAFAYCTNMTSVTIPNSAISIGDYAFESCSNMASVTIPTSVTSIGNDAFLYCT